MSCRSTILIDNFLSASDFNSISSRVVSSEQYYDTKHHDMRDDLWTDVTNLVFNRLKEINLYQFQSNLSADRTVDISNVFLKDKIESLNRDLSTVYVKLKLLDNIQVRLENLKQEIEDLDTKLTENTNQKK